MEDEKPQLPRDVPPYRWFIGILADGTYRFITPYDLASAEAYIGQHGGGVYTHAGYLVFAANRRWFEWLTKNTEEGQPDLDIPNIECTFSPSALKWLEENDALLKEQGGKYYENIPRH